jgi:hypothetical protein
MVVQNSLSRLLKKASGTDSLTVAARQVPANTTARFRAARVSKRIFAFFIILLDHVSPLRGVRLS